MATALNIILVEDHDDLRAATVAALSEMGHVVRGIDCAEALDDEVARFPAELLILDLNLPGEDGLSIARRMRGAMPDIGIIMVTARNQARDVALGYTSGADIYVTKPTTPEELGAAIAALSRRMRPAAAAQPRIVLDPRTLRMHGGKSAVDVSDSECALLTALARAADHRLETWQLLELTGKPLDEASKKSLEVQIVRLRKKLEQAGADGPTLKAIRGSGYQLCTPVVIGKPG